MTLKSFGCSFIYGTDLADADSDFTTISSASKSTWPGLLAQSNGQDYHCFARPGAGNLIILEKVITESTVSDSSDVFVIGWTWIDRFDYTIELMDQYHEHECSGPNQWRTIMPMDSDYRAELYHKEIHSQYRDKLTSLTYIKTAIDILNQKNIPFIMTYMDDLIFETEWHVTPSVLYLQDCVRPYMTTFENKTFLDFSKEKGFPISKTLHPLEVAHQSAFELIRSRFDAILHKA